MVPKLNFAEIVARLPAGKLDLWHLEGSEVQEHWTLKV